MVTRACISINNRCNLNCTYCHFHEKKDYIQEDNMDVITILDIITSHIEDNDIDLFKLGFVGNGEPMLDYEKLKQYIAHIGDYLKSGRIAAYTITNGLLVDREKLEFFKEYNVNVGFSVDGISAIHDKYRCGTHEQVMNPKQDDTPVINTERVVIVDSVINTGKSIMRIIDELKNHNPGIDVIIAANVIQNEAAELFKDYLVFATRLSKNSFVGVNQSKQTGKTGPDTADRLFNLIKKRY